MFLNIAKIGETTTKFQLPGPKRNRAGTGNYFNLIMRNTVLLRFCERCSIGKAKILDPKDK